MACCSLLSRCQKLMFLKHTYLRGIVDDLLPVPFLFQEVNSEDGEPPPPTGSSGAGPSRMSVTQATQQVLPPADSIAGKGIPSILRSSEVYWFIRIGTVSSIPSARAARALHRLWPIIFTVCLADVETFGAQAYGVRFFGSKSSVDVDSHGYGCS